MRLDRLEASGFRNLDGSVSFGPGLNILFGDNAQGKTNWLEAVYLLGNTKSFRTRHLRDVIAFGSDSALIRGAVARGSLGKDLQFLARESSKELYVNGKREAVSRYLGNLDVFVFSAEELSVVRGDPAERRRFLDRGIVTVLPSYLGTLSQYNHAIKQKNRLLAVAKESGHPNQYQSQVEAWNEHLVELGASVYEARMDYVTRMASALEANDHGRDIFGAERVTIRYRSQFEGKGNLENYGDLFRERLALRLPAELAAGHSLIGPHRDDLEILIEGREIARFGSAGQQKSALFILDLAQVSIYNLTYEESPVLLIDDIDAELDRGRIEAVLSELENRVQTIVSTARRGIARRYEGRAMTHSVENGIAVPSVVMPGETGSASLV